MDRRQFLALTAAGATVGSAGCVASSSEGSESDGDDRSRFEQMQDAAVESGESVEYQYKIATVHELVLAEEVVPAANQQEESQDEQEGPEPLEPPTAGGLWALSRLEIEHTGRQRRDYPASNDSYFVYEDYDESELFTPESPVEVRGDRYHLYEERFRSRDIDNRGAFPGVTVSGWLLHEVPRQYDLDQFMLVLPLGVDMNEQPWVFDESDVTRVPSRDYDG